MTRRHFARLALGCCLLALLGAAYRLGTERERSAADDARHQAAAERQQRGLLEQEMQRRTALLDQLGAERIADAVRASGAENADSDLPAPTPSGDDPSPETTRARDLLAALEGMSENPDLYDQTLYYAVAAELGVVLRNDASARAWAIATFLDPQQGEAATLLVEALGEQLDPAVAAAAVQLAESGGDRAARERGLRVLDRLDDPRTATLDGVRRILTREKDADLLAAALYALDQPSPDPAERRATVQAVAPLTAHTDPELRRRAVIALSTWSPDESSLVPSIGALQDSSHLVRQGAAFGLGRAATLSAEATEALLARVQDPEEDATVRDLSALSLLHHPLDDATYAVVSTHPSVARIQGTAAEQDLEPESN